MCINAIVPYDPIKRVGGLLHAMLPQAPQGQSPLKANTSRYIDTGVSALLQACYSAGAMREHPHIRIAGGASIYTNPDDDVFQIGKRNFLTLQEILKAKGLLINEHDVGGTEARSMILCLANGEVHVRRLTRRSGLGQSWGLALGNKPPHGRGPETISRATAHELNSLTPIGVYGVDAHSDDVAAYTTPFKVTPALKTRRQGFLSLGSTGRPPAPPSARSTHRRENSRTSA